MRPLSQRHPAWSHIPLGLSRVTTIGTHGCTVTCLAMLADTTPDEVNQRLLKARAYANTNLVIWYKIHDALPSLTWEVRSQTYNHSAVLRAVRNYGACMVEVDFDGTGRGDNRHWVLYIDGGMLIDPWTGLIEPQHKYPVRTGYSVIKRAKEEPKPPIIEDEDMTPEQRQEIVEDTARAVGADIINNHFVPAIRGLRRRLNMLEGSMLRKRPSKENREILEYYSVDKHGREIESYGSEAQLYDAGWRFEDAK